MTEDKTDNVSPAAEADSDSIEAIVDRLEAIQENQAAQTFFESDPKEKESEPFDWQKWSPIVAALAGLIIGLTSLVEAQTAKIASQTAQETSQEASQTSQETQSGAVAFESQIIQARQLDEAALNEVLNTCRDYDRFVRYYAQNIEQNLTMMVQEVAIKALDEPLAYSPARFPTDIAIDRSHQLSLEEKLAELYGDDELDEFIRLIDYQRSLSQ